MNFEFLLTPEGQKHVAIATALIIAFAFAIGAHPFKKAKQLFVLAEAEEPNLWVAGDYYTFLRANIMTCPNFKELEDMKRVVEDFFEKEFRVPISCIDRKRYYARLLEAITQRENALESELMTNLCQN
jgi:hypothetical protein